MDSLTKPGGYAIRQSDCSNGRSNSGIPAKWMHINPNAPASSLQHSIHIMKKKDSVRNQERTSPTTRENYDNPLTLLVAEDEDINFMLIREYLAPLNYNVLRAENGQVAVDICRSNANITLVLMDMRMPTMNGFDATRSIKEHRPELPIIAVTAYNTDHDRLRARTSGCDGFLGKPFKRDQLIGKIRSCLDINSEEKM